MARRQQQTDDAQDEATDDVRAAANAVLRGDHDDEDIETLAQAALDEDDEEPTDEDIAASFGVDPDAVEPVDPEDLPEVPEPLDVSEYKSAAGMAKAVHARLQQYAESIGADPEAVLLYDPAEAATKRKGTGAWTVAWEGGPFEWANALLAGRSLASREFAGGTGAGGDAQVTGFYDNDDVHVEPYYSFDLQFFEVGR